MSYVPQPVAGYGAYGGMQAASPYLDAKVIEAQKSVLKAEFERNVTMATQQFEQQMLQQTMQLEQQYRQQTMELDMAKQQRDMMITSQAAQMTADAQQHKLQIDMQTKMASLYSTGLATAAGAAPAAKPSAPKP